MRDGHIHGTSTTETHVLTPHYQFISIKYVNSYFFRVFVAYTFRTRAIFMFKHLFHTELIIISKKRILMSFGQLQEFGFAGWIFLFY